ncbi:MAG: pantoate--beta-alanine ligase [Gemmatimonadetes bacterium]|jgi:pantoate--beta-alanine ligase|nr:pantoate--beta-alanine ligase [Gemmatimonadota bacterium]
MPTPPLLDTVAAMHQQADAWHRQDLRIGLVPTMGYLHDGHLSLVERCRRESDRTVVSIFVNPLQFGPQEDFDIYPRDLDRDLELLSRHGVEAVFHPIPEEFYPDGFATSVEVEGLTSGLCGAFRPGHFSGVTTVVTKLFTATRPDVAVFGQKDYQQSAVIRRMVRDLNLGIDIVVAPTVREADGLAMSSRNINLTAQERERAPLLYQFLSQTREAILAGEQDAENLIERMRLRIAAELTDRIDYIAIVDPDSLKSVAHIRGPVVVALAVRLGKVRLIDNILIESPSA